GLRIPADPRPALPPDASLQAIDHQQLRIRPSERLAQADDPKKRTGRQALCEDAPEWLSSAHASPLFCGFAHNAHVTMFRKQSQGRTPSSSYSKKMVARA